MHHSTTPRGTHGPRRRSRSGAFATIAVSIALLVLVAGQHPAAAQRKGPLAGMTAVEASKDIELPDNAADEDAVRQGRYLVSLLGCASCHTDGALIGKPDPARTLAGSSIGIAYSNPMVDDYPGAVYPPNLTPDEDTGLGRWSLEEIVTMLRTGKNRHGSQTMAIMPWTSYALLSLEDATAIAAYLKSLEPIAHRVPERVLPGNPANTPLVHVGLYRSR